jgi:hypothetical protein
MKLPRITIVITEVSQPFLYASLKHEGNDRARAALLKRLAEDGARIQTIGIGRNDAAAAPSGVDPVEPQDPNLNDWFK